MLTLTDVFHSGAWKEGLFLPAGQKESLQAMSRSLDCSDTIARYPLELRFGQATGKLTVAVAQDTASPSSDGSVEFSVRADGRMVGTARVTFKERAELEVPLAGVAAVKVEAKRVDRPCRGVVTALITKLALEG